MYFVVAPSDVHRYRFKSFFLSFDYLNVVFDQVGFEFLNKRKLGVHGMNLNLLSVVKIDHHR